MRSTRTTLLTGFMLTMALTLSACGGGGSSNDDDDQADFSDSALQISAGSDSFNPDGITISDIQLFWEQTGEFDFYRLFVNPDGASGYTKIGADIPAEDVEDLAEDAQIFLSRFVDQDLDYPIPSHLFDWDNAMFLLRGCTGSGPSAECVTVGQRPAEEVKAFTVDGFTTKSPDNTFATTFGISVDISETGLVAAVGANTATLLECTDDEIEVVDGEATENCQTVALPDCADLEEGDDSDCFDPEIDCDNLSDDEDTPAQCRDDPVFKTVVNAGVVYLYYRDSLFDPWQLAPIIQAEVPNENDNFGWAVSLSNDGATLLVAAPGEDSSDRSRPRNNSAESSGAAYVFKRKGDEWLQTAFLKAANAETNDLFGWSAEISGNGEVIAVGSAQRNACRGAVYTYTQNDNNAWIQRAALTAPAAAENDVFGQSLAMDFSGATLAIGANQFPDDELLPGCVQAERIDDNGAGKVFVYNRSGIEWSPVATLTASNADPADRFGNSVALNGNSTGNGVAKRLIVGAPVESSDATGVNGREGNEAITISSGAAYLFEKRGNNWVQTQYFKASNTGPTDQFGIDVSITDGGTIAAVGAWGESGFGAGINPIEAFDVATASGAVYVFREDATPGLWTQTAYVKPPFVTPFGNFGWSVALSDEAETMLVGSPAFSRGLSQAGNVFIY